MLVETTALAELRILVIAQGRNEWVRKKARQMAWDTSNDNASASLSLSVADVMYRANRFDWLLINSLVFFPAINTRRSLAKKKDQHLRLPSTSRKTFVESTPMTFQIYSIISIYKTGGEKKRSRREKKSKSIDVNLYVNVTWWWSNRRAHTRRQVSKKEKRKRPWERQYERKNWLISTNIITLRSSNNWEKQILSGPMYVAGNQ